MTKIIRVIKVTTVREYTVFPMDVSATVYPYFATKTIHHSFTMEVSLDRDVDPDRLQTVVERMIERFPTLFVRIRKGAFGYKLEHIHDASKFIMPRPEILNLPYDLDGNEPLMRITYRANRLAVECFHSVTDGSGAITLLKSIVAEYYRTLGEEIPSTCGVLSPDDEPKETETEDSFLTRAVKGGKTVGRSGKAAYQFEPKGPFETWHQTELSMPLADIKPVAKAAGATLTEYIVALYLYAFYVAAKARKSKKPIIMSVPINLRPVFESETLRNFSLFFLASVPKGDDVTLEQILENVKREFKQGTEKDLLQRMINTNAAQQQMAAFRALPRVLKRRVLRIGGALFAERLFTSTLSNLGIFNVPDELSGHIQTFHAVLGQVPTNHILTTAYCYNGTLGLMFSSRLASREIERSVRRLLQERGVRTTMRDNAEDIPPFTAETQA